MQCKHENQQCLPESILNFREIISSRKTESFLRKFLKDLFVVSCWVVFLIIFVLLCSSLLREKNLWKINPLYPNSDQHQFSPYNITPKSQVKVMSVKEMIINKRSF